MDMAATVSTKPLNYDMLSSYVENAMKRRPVKRTTIKSLKKTSLISFLQENDIDFPANCMKDVLVDIVINVLEQDARKGDQHVLESTSTVTDSNITSTSDLLLPKSNVKKSSPAAAGKPSDLSHFNVSEPLTISESSGNTNKNIAQPVSTGNPWDLSASGQNHCGSNTIHKYLTHTNGSGHSNKNSASELLEPPISVPSGVEKTRKKQPLILEPCNAVYIENGIVLPDSDWEPMPSCACYVDIEVLTQEMLLPKVAMDILISNHMKPIDKIVEFLQTFGEQSLGSGCRIQLLLQLRDMLEQQFNAIPSTSKSNENPCCSKGPSTFSQSRFFSSTHNISNPEKKMEINSSGAKLDFLHKDKLPHSNSIPAAAAKLSAMNSVPPIAKLSHLNLAPHPSLKQCGTNSGPPVEKLPILKSVPLAAKLPHTKSNATVTVEATLPNANPDRKRKQEEQLQLSQDFAKKMAKDLCGAWGGSAQVPAATSSLQDQEKECCICITAERQVAFVPCGHAVCCRTCATKVIICPVCRKKVKSRLNIYFT